MATDRWNGPLGERDGSQQGRPRLRLLATFGALGLLLVTAQIVFATPPTLSISAPSVLQIGQTGTFTATVADPDPDGGIASVEWDFGNDGTFEESGVSFQHSFGTAGQKTVRVRVTDTATPPEVTEDTVTVRVNAEPNASFTANPNPAQLGQTVNFNGSASSDPDGTIATYEWDLDNDGAFDDGTGTTQSRAYTAGQHTVWLRVRDNDGATDIAAVTVVVNTPPNAVLTVAPTTAVIGQTINLSGSGSSDPDGSIAAYAWDTDNDGAFDDGTGVTTTTSFSTPGTKTVRLRVTDNHGGTDVDTKTVTIHRAPTATLTATGTKVDVAGVPITPSVPDVGETVAFAASAGDPDGGPIVGYAWDLDGNGSFETDTGTTASTTSSYASRGSKTVRVRVTDNQGATGEGSVTFRVNALPVAKILFAASNPDPGQNTQVPVIATTPPSVPVPGQTVAFASGSTDEESTNAPQTNNTIAAYQWIDANIPGTGPFGPFGTAAGVVHPAYTSAGDMRVVLRVTDADGATDDEIATVRVNTRPVADFTFSPQTPVANEPITFAEAADDPDPDNLTNPANGLVTKFEWDLDNDGTFGEAGEVGQRVQTSFATAGERTVSLRVTDGGGARSVRIDKEVDVQLTRPDAAFDFSPQDPLPGQQVSFRSTSAPTAGKTIEKVEWDFDNDGQFKDGTGVATTTSFSTPGTKTVRLQVTETGGGIDIATGTVRVNAPPQASFRAAPSTPLVGDAMTFSSTSSDPDGPIQQVWDTDNDGRFDDGTGAVATRTFAAPGTYTIALLVTDDRGARAVTSGQVRIVARPLASLRFLDATVTIAGRLNPIGADVNLLRVRAPAGARAVVKCFGKAKGCPGKRAQARVLKRNQTRFKRFERQLRAGARITVAVTMDGFIGRFTRFNIRAGKAPKRTDLCLHPGTKKPSACA